MNITEKKLLDGYQGRMGNGNRCSIIGEEYFFWEYKWNKIKIFYSTVVWLVSMNPEDFLTPMDFPQIVYQERVDENTLQEILE